MGDDIKRVLEEETAEREIAKLENRAGKLQNRINGEQDDRTWFQTKQQRKEEKQKLKQQQKDPTFTKRKMRKKIIDTKKVIDPAEAKALKDAQHDYEYIHRDAKRKRKKPRIKMFDEDDNDNVPKPAKKKAKNHH